MIREGFVGHKNYRWMWLNLTFLLILTVLYIYDRPLGGASGGTLYGYTVGGIATAAILYLMWFGIRKRAYASHDTTLKGCLSAHVWLGISLTFMVPLHAGFSFGLNVHTAAYALMVIVIVSGIWGALNYATLAPLIHSHRGGGSFKNSLSQIELMSADVDKMSAGKSDQFLKLLRAVDFTFEPRFWRLLFGKREAEINRKQSSELIAALPDGEREDGIKLIGLINKKREIVSRLRDDVSTLFWLRAWLYVHLPISFALLAVLAIHIYSVFFMW